MNEVTLEARWGRISNIVYCYYFCMPTDGASRSNKLIQLIVLVLVPLPPLLLHSSCGIVSVNNYLQMIAPWPGCVVFELFCGMRPRQTKVVKI